MSNKALVIDDSGIMRKMVIEAVKEAGIGEFEYEEAGDGAEGLTKFKTGKFKLVFIDWNMPNMSGIEFVHEAVKLKCRDDALLIMVTSEKASSKVDEAINHAGADGYIGKPFTANDVAAKLKRLVGRVGL